MHSFWKNKGMWRKSIIYSRSAGNTGCVSVSVVAAASHFVCGRSQGCRRLRFRGSASDWTSERGRERETEREGARKLYCFIRTRWESFVEASMPLSLFASRQQWIDMIILWCLRFNSTKVFHVMTFMRREPLADLPLAVGTRAGVQKSYLPFFLILILKPFCLEHLHAFNLWSPHQPRPLRGEDPLTFPNVSPARLRRFSASSPSVPVW